MITYLIVPALTDQAGQCRIVARNHGTVYRPGLEDYRINPRLWREVGLMDGRGNLRCLSAPAEIYRDIQSCTPLAAGLIFTYEDV